MFVCLRGTAEEYLFCSYNSLFILTENLLTKGEILDNAILTRLRFLKH